MNSLFVTRPGFEPRQAEPESAVLPLYYRAKCKRQLLLRGANIATSTKAQTICF